MAMTILERPIGEVTILDVDGRLTVQEGADEFRDVVQRLVRAGRLKVVLNMAAVPYIDSTALGQLIRAYTTLARMGGALKLLNVTGRVRDLLVLTKLLPVFDPFDAEADAVNSFGGARA
jgi:anti-sigma B factor antagonist